MPVWPPRISRWSRASPWRFGAGRWASIPPIESTLPWQAPLRLWRSSPSSPALVFSPPCWPRFWRCAGAGRTCRRATRKAMVPGRQFLLLDQYIGEDGWLHALVYRLLEVPFPLSKILEGIGEAFQHSVDGHDAYLFGHVSRHGWWYFFPVVLLVKTPLAFMALAGLGAVMAIHDSNARASEGLAAGAAMVQL